MGKAWDGWESPAAYQRWCLAWAAQCLRVLKPGGHLLAFGGTRTAHRMTCAIEDAGFEIRDGIAWLHSQGFPKSLDVSKAIDKTGTSDDAKQWAGWGTALKPAMEMIAVARKPLGKGMTVAANVLTHGTGALNIDACRVGSDVMRESRMTQVAGGVLNANGRDVEHGNWQQKPNNNPAEHTGRWPANVVLDEAAAAKLDAQSDSSSRFFPVFKYQAKAPTKERPKVEGVAHPTVKPLELMRWLVRLATPPGGIVLDPFVGSGTTIEACLMEGMDCVAIECDATYLPLINERISRASAGRL